MLAETHEPVPGPTGLPVVGSLWEMDGDPLRFMTRVARRYGDVARFRAGPDSFVMVSHPSLVEDLLVGLKDHTTKDRITRGLDEVLGQGLLTSDGPHWRTQRRRVAPSFQPRHLAAYGDAMTRSTLERLPEPGVRDVHASTGAIALDIVIRTLFGAEPGGETDRVGALLGGLMDAFETEQRTIWRVIPDWVPGPHRRAVKRSTAELDALLMDLVARAREAGAGDSLLGRLLDARDDDGVGMTDRELRDELVTLFLAGHETTALTLAYTLWLLAEHPEHQDRVRAELDTVLGDRDPVAADLRALPLLHAVLDESMRLYPPAWAVGRETLDDVVLGGHRIPAGTQVTASQWVVHRDPRFWVGPDRFRPDRWLNGETKDLPRMAFFPFGGGPRVCVGNHFAKMEAALVLATLLRHRRFATTSGLAPDLLPAVTLRPRSGLQLEVLPREVR